MTRALSGALFRYLHVPVDLVVYPGAAHGLSRRTHREATMAWDLIWFQHHLAK